MFSTNAQNADTTKLTADVVSALANAVIASPTGVATIAPNENVTVSVVVTSSSLGSRIATNNYYLTSWLILFYLFKFL